jgi:hypothetical protein
MVSLMVRLCVCRVFFHHVFALFLKLFHYLLSGESVIVAAFGAYSKAGPGHEGCETTRCLSADYAFVSWDPDFSI